MISCNQHDYVEIACMYHCLVILTLKSGDVIQGRAVDTERNQNREECIKVDVNDAECLVVLADIVKMEAVTENPHFQAITFD